MSIRQLSTTSGFLDLGLDDKIVNELFDLGYEEPTPIQKQAIPHLLAGKDLLGQAATGTGKTAAFALPLLQNLYAGEGRSKRSSPSGIILTPTRELAIQVAEAIHKYGRSLGVTVLPIYGGADMRQQLRALSRGVDIVVATPGRALDHIRRGSLTLSKIHTVVLDEADEMLDMGFAEDLEAILNKVPSERQTALFSATMAPRVTAVANRHLKDPERVNIVHDTMKIGTTPNVRQVAYVVPRQHKTATLGRVLDMEGSSSTIVFCRTRTEVDELTEAMTVRGYRAGALHGGLSQAQRDRIMKNFRSGTMDLLIATDVAARGLDVDHLSHVVNFSIPTSPEVYIHRIGRTGRAGRQGAAITLIEPREHGYLRSVERLTKQKIEVATIPTAADLHAKRLELTSNEIKSALSDNDADKFRSVVRALVDAGNDLMDVAAAAVKVAHKALGNDSDTEVEIPAFDPKRKPDDRSRKPKHKAGDRKKSASEKSFDGRTYTERAPKGKKSFKSFSAPGKSRKGARFNKPAKPFKRGGKAGKSRTGTR